jgi:hypothetical protein
MTVSSNAMMVRIRHTYPASFLPSLLRGGALLGGLAVLLSLVAGCGTSATPASAAGGGVVTLGPRPVGGVEADGEDGSGEGAVDEPGDDGDAGGDEITDSGNGGAGDGAEGDPGDEDAGDDGENDDAGIDACAVTTGRSFFAPNASLSFVRDALGDTFIWTVGGIQAMGIVECAGTEMTGLTADGQVFTGRYLRLDDAVVWEGLSYRPASPR